MSTVAQLFKRHCHYLVRRGAIGDEFDSLSFRLGVLNELLESSSLDEEFNCILQVDAIVSHVLVAYLESTVLCLFDPLPFLRRGF